MKTLDTTQFASSTATFSKQGVTSAIERSIANSRSTVSNGRSGTFAIGTTSAISNCSVINKTSQSAAFQAETVEREASGLNTSRVTNRGPVFVATRNDAQMENCFFITARSGGFSVNSRTIRGIGDQADQAETGSWKISSYQSGNQSKRIAKAA